LLSNRPKGALLVSLHTPKQPAPISILIVGMAFAPDDTGKALAILPAGSGRWIADRRTGASGGENALVSDKAT